MNCFVGLELRDSDGGGGEKMMKVGWESLSLIRNEIRGFSRFIDLSPISFDVDLFGNTFFLLLGADPTGLMAQGN